MKVLLKYLLWSNCDCHLVPLLLVLVLLLDVVVDVAYLLLLYTNKFSQINQNPWFRCFLLAFKGVQKLFNFRQFRWSNAEEMNFKSTPEEGNGTKT